MIKLLTAIGTVSTAKHSSIFFSGALIAFNRGGRVDFVDQDFRDAANRL